MLAPQPKPIPTDPLGKLQYGNERFVKDALLPPKVDEMTRYTLETEGSASVRGGRLLFRFARAA
jgi:hypothetical protein